MADLKCAVCLASSTGKFAALVAKRANVIINGYAICEDHFKQKDIREKLGSKL